MQTIQTSKDLGFQVQFTRKAQGLTQLQLAAASGVGVRFIRDLEQGKESCHLGKSLLVAHMLGLSLHLKSGDEL